MAELTQEQIKQAMWAAHSAAAPGFEWGNLSERDVERYSLAVKAAAPFLQLPWDEPTEDEVTSIYNYCANTIDGNLTPRCLCEFVRRRNTALLPKMVDPRIAKLIVILRAPWVTQEDRAIKILAEIDEV